MTPRISLLTLAAVALTGSMAFALQPPPVPASDPAPAAAPIERQPPSGPGMPQRPMDQHRRPGMSQGPMRPGMMQGQGPRSVQNKFHAEAMMHGHEGFKGGSGGGFHGGPGESTGGAFHIAPQGMWWKNPMVVQKLTLTPDQVKRMDDIFQEARIQLIDLHANVEKQEVMLEPMLSANPPDTTKALAQIDKVAQARADLEKADAKMLLGIRVVLTPDQWTKLSSHGGQGGPGGPESQGGPGGGGHGRGNSNIVEPRMEP